MVAALYRVPSCYTTPALVWRHCSSESRCFCWEQSLTFHLDEANACFVKVLPER
uniref:Uncharacterized protein n=1 Tax=Oryza brachyantha TaxID=4533 RepID=J3MAU6_ORYBR